MAGDRQHNSAAAYDLSRFEEHSERRTLRVVKNNRPAPSLLFGLSPLAVIFTAVIVVSITALFIYNNVMLTEIGAQISVANQQYAELESENVRLKASLDNKMSTKSIEEAAEDRLGLVKVDRNQIEYINLAPNDVVEVAQKDLADGNLLERTVAKIKEYLNH